MSVASAGFLFAGGATAHAEDAEPFDAVGCKKIDSHTPATSEPPKPVHVLKAADGSLNIPVSGNPYDATAVNIRAFVEELHKIQAEKGLPITPLENIYVGVGDFAKTTMDHVDAFVAGNPLPPHSRHTATGEVTYDTARQDANLANVYVKKLVDGWFDHVAHRSLLFENGFDNYIGDHSKMSRDEVIAAQNYDPYKKYPNMGLVVNISEKWDDSVKPGTIIPAHDNDKNSFVSDARVDVVRDVNDVNKGMDGASGRKFSEMIVPVTSVDPSLKTNYTVPERHKELLTEESLKTRDSAYVNFSHADDEATTTILNKGQLAAEDRHGTPKQVPTLADNINGMAKLEYDKDSVNKVKDAISQGDTVSVASHVTSDCQHQLIPAPVSPTPAPENPVHEPVKDNPGAPTNPVVSPVTHPVVPVQLAVPTPSAVVAPAPKTEEPVSVAPAQVDAKFSADASASANAGANAAKGNADANANASTSASVNGDSNANAANNNANGAAGAKQNGAELANTGADANLLGVAGVALLALAGAVTLIARRVKR